MESALGLGTTIDRLQHRVLGLLNTSPLERRIIIALSGVPGSGKSTIVTALLAQLERAGIRHVAVAPMDGFHFTKATLQAFENPKEAFRRRGAPFTFDATAFVEAVASLRDDSMQDVWLPGFDHANQDPVPREICISATTRVIIVEGNYVLLNQEPWNQVASMADERWFVDTPRDIAMHRIANRHVTAKIENTLEAAKVRAETNDLPNGDYIRDNLIEPDVVIHNY